MKPPVFQKSSFGSKNPPKKKWGQHFLVDPGAVKKIVNALVLEETNQIIVEIGPGKGAITTDLLRTYPHQPTVLVEIDPLLAADLAVHYKTNPLVRVVQQDILLQSFDQLLKSCLLAGKVSVVGNFPYNISQPLFFKFWKEHRQIDSVVGVVQHEVAQRICAKPGNKSYGMLSVLVQTVFEATYLFALPPAAFHPAPKVTSAVLRLVHRQTTPEPAANQAVLLQLVKWGFAQRRKILRNAWRPLREKQKRIPSSWLKKRAEELSVTDFLQAAQLVADS